MKTSDFSYQLPDERIAKLPSEPRDACKLLVCDRNSYTFRDEHFFDIENYVHAGDVMVRNVSRVFCARLFVYNQRTEKHHEVLIVKFLSLSPSGYVQVEALCRNSKKVLVDDVLVFGNEREEIRSHVTAKHADGRLEIVFQEKEVSAVIDFCNRWGEIPLPPYIGKQDIPLSTYQTVYAKETGSVAAPTAGFHFTNALIERLEKKGVVFVDVVLHVGIGTFRPMQTELLRDHVMHAEYVEIDESAITAIIRAQQNGNKVFAIGTTSVRVLEGVAELHGGVLQPYHGEVSLFITPGFRFRVVDALITNFHLPESTLLVLVSTYMGIEYARSAYAHAIEHEYNFYSFGDAMLIL